MLEINKIYNIDNIEGMKLIDDNFIDLTVTSPPYDDLRTYNGYTFDFESTAKELFRITKKGGVVVWIVGDQTIKGGESATSFKQALDFIETGFTLYDTMIYQKAGNLPSKNRYVQSFEYMFVLSKGKPKSINLIKDKQNKWAGQSTFGKSSFRNKDGTLTIGKKRIINEFGTRENIWRYANGYGFGQKDKIAYQHPATFPEQLVHDHIISWSNENDIILDPFMGSGTTAKVAKLLNRNFIGFDISKEYCEIAEERLRNNN